MTPTLSASAGIILVLTAPVPGWSQPASRDSVRGDAKAARNVLYVNPLHLAKGNITLSYERFTSPQRSFRVILSGSRQADYVGAAFDLSFYPAPPAAVNYFIGGSFIAYESPILTGVPISQPWNRFFESPDDRYYVGLQVKNGGVFRLREFLNFEIDAAMGPVFNVGQGKWLSVWGIGVNLGIPF